MFNLFKGKNISNVEVQNIEKTKLEGIASNPETGKIQKQQERQETIDKQKKIDTKERINFSHSIDEVPVFLSAFETNRILGNALQLIEDLYKKDDGLKYFPQTENAENQLKQLAGHAAEKIYATRETINNIMHGSKEKVLRTDDIIGRVNDEFFDILKLDPRGNIIPGSGIQMKFEGKNAKEAFDWLFENNHAKYHENNVPIAVPKDYYPEIKKRLGERIKYCSEQMEKNPHDIENKKMLELTKKIDKTLRDSGITNEEAQLAVKNPEKFVQKEVTSVWKQSLLKSGLTTGTIGAGFTGAIETAKNIYELSKGEISAPEAVKNVAKETGKAGAYGFSIGALTETIETGFEKLAPRCQKIAENALKNFPKLGELVPNLPKIAEGTFKGLSKAGIPIMIAVTSVDFAVEMKKYADGKTSSEEFKNNMIDKAAETAGATIGASVGTAVIPVPVLGTVVGGAVGIALAKGAELAADWISSEGKEIASETKQKIADMAENAKQNMENILANFLEKTDTSLSEIKDFVKSFTSEFETGRV